MIPLFSGHRNRHFPAADSTAGGAWFTAAHRSTGGRRCCHTMPPPRLESRAPGRRLGTPMTADHRRQVTGLLCRLENDHHCLARGSRWLHHSGSDPQVLPIVARALAPRLRDQEIDARTVLTSPSRDADPDCIAAPFANVEPGATLVYS